MKSTRIGGRTFLGPVIVPSVSSFETQIQPADALRLQSAIREPITLVSAFDIKKRTDDLVECCRNFRSHGCVLVDSGGYEASRISQYCNGQSGAWSFEDYRSIAGIDMYDAIFSFDYFIDADEENESFDDFSLRLVSELQTHDFIESAKLIPVLHRQSRNNRRRISDDQLIDMAVRVATEFSPPVYCDT